MNAPQPLSLPQLSLDSPLQGKIYLNKGREKSLHKRHPWLFSGAIQRLEGQPEAGDLVSVHAHDGSLLAQGFYHPQTQISVRLLCFDDRPVNTEFFRQRLLQALQWRQRWLPHSLSNARRLVHAEADGLPGLVLDQYADVLALQISSMGLARRKESLLALIQDLLPARLVVERSESPALQTEGLAPVREILSGSGSTEVEIHEAGVRMGLDVMQGQKTGFFIDQRDSRLLVGKLAANMHLLNCFSYTGGFSLHAAMQGARTTSVEISAKAQEQARHNFALNGLDPDQHHFETANVFDYLRGLKPFYDMIILDPPAFVKQRKHLPKASRAYQDINRLAMQHSRPDGLLLTCSCSHFMDWDLFQKIVFAAAIEAGREVQLLQRLGQPWDHPTALQHPEGEYLKAFLLRVL